MVVIKIIGVIILAASITTLFLPAIIDYIHYHKRMVEHDMHEERKHMFDLL